MFSSRRDPLPIEAVRDLLGIARALYAADKQRGAGAGRLAEIAAAGKDLADAIELARTSQPNTIGHRSAWAHAERGLERLANIVSIIEEIRPVLEAAGERVRR